MMFIGSLASKFEAPVTPTELIKPLKPLFVKFVVCTLIESVKKCDQNVSSAMEYHPSFLRGVKSKVDELGRFFQGYLGVPLGPQKGQETNTFTEKFFPFSSLEIRTRYL